MWAVGVKHLLSILTANIGPTAASDCFSFARKLTSCRVRVQSFCHGIQAYSTSPQKVGRLNHIAIAVPDLATASERYKSVLGAKVSDPQSLPEHGVRVVFVNLPNTKLELLEPLGEASPIANFLKKNPAGGLHHICLEVEDIKGSISHVGKAVRVLDPVPKIGAHGNPVSFLHPKDCDGVLIELEQVTSDT